MTNLGQIDAFLVTDKGQVRDLNEDYFIAQEPATPTEEIANGWLYIVADGVGGADAGEVASEYASQRTLHHFLAHADENDWGQRLYQAMQAANTDLRAMAASQNSNARGMATTMVAVLIHEHDAVIANVGDSRGYLWRQGEIRQITKDQSLVARLVEEGAITAEQAQNHRHKNIILFSLGSERQPRIDLFPVPLADGDILLLCSDGLIRHVADEEMAATLALTQDAAAAARQLLRMAYDRGGEDNISVAVIRFRPESMRRQPLVAPPADETHPAADEGQSGANRTFLWLYTAFLCLAQSVLIFLVWLLLQN
ncbi:MAG: Stp1/IreP family PP2C-type Ser/Thr phosphatase [Ardenticatenales bacterium]|nr:Stp1/IreP family PP2C-type Ser/Thr phosphatase [Ardenticatenales bacterium]